MRPLLALALLLVLAPAAHAGGWATVEASGVPDGVSAGRPFDLQLVVKQHGRTPLDGLTPRVQITSESGDRRTFTAVPAGSPGTYVARVTYPAEGTWRTRLFDGFTDATPHRLAPLQVQPAGSAPTAPDRPAGTPADDGGPISAQAVAIGIVVLLFAAAFVIVARRERYLPAP